MAVAKIEFVKGSITGEQYPVLRVYTGQQSMGRDYITLKMSCMEFEWDKEARLKDLTDIANAINEAQTHGD